MRVMLLSLFLVACGEKTPPVAAAEAVEAAPVAAADEAAPEPEPEPEPEVASSNVDFNMSISFADGSSKSGHVRYLEVSVDGIGDKGWEDSVDKLTMYGSKDGTEKKLAFTDITKASIKPGSVPADTSCTYSSDWTPWMYDCTVKTTSAITLQDGSTWKAEVPRRKWRATFDDGEAVEFWFYNYSVFEQDSQAVSLETLDAENRDLYTKLQQQLREELTTNKVVTGITLN